MGKYDDKTEDPTPKRRREARKEGRIARSPDLVAWVLLMIALNLLPGMISRVGHQLELTVHSITQMAAEPSATKLPGVVGDTLWAALMAMGPTLAGCVAIAMVGDLAQVGLVFTGKPLKPTFSKLNPLTGIKQMFSMRSVWQVAASALRLGVIVVIVGTRMEDIVSQLLNASSKPPTEIVSQIGHAGLDVSKLIVEICVGIGLIDYFIKRRDIKRQLRMSKQELKQEAKDAEGDPHVKGRMRSMRLQMSRNRMINSVIHADVVITNPTHLAIAIKYRGENGAPRVVARGAGSLAAKIRAEADRHDVPRVEAKPLARALYTLCRPGEEIPAELYQAVATVLAFLHRLGATHRAYRGRLAVNVPDSWSPRDGSPLKRVSPETKARQARLAQRGSGRRAA